MSALLPAPGVLARRRPPLLRPTPTALPVASAAAAPSLLGRRFFAAAPAKAAAAAAAAAATGERTSTNLFQAPKGHPPGIGALLARYRSIPLERTRCFAIIAHIDHGKSTLSDKLLEATANIWPTVKGAQQVLDTLEVERARGITVKAQSASMVWTDPRSGLDYLLNLIDTPGHVDFAYEVSRSLAACQGALLLVDASQGVQAQTVANHNAAAEAGLRIIPVLTKIDLPTADPEPALTALEGAFGVDANSALWTSAKSGAGIGDVFPAVVDRLPPPPGGGDARSRPLRALLFDSWFDAYRGVVCSVLVVEGVLRPGDAIVAAHSGDKFTVQEVGLMAPAKVPLGSLSGPGSGAVAASAAAAAAAAGDGGGSNDVPPGCLGAGHMGYMIAGMKSTKQVRRAEGTRGAGRGARRAAGVRQL
jgi:small GTP-binding protein